MLGMVVFSAFLGIAGHFLFDHSRVDSMISGRQQAMCDVVHHRGVEGR